MGWIIATSSSLLQWSHCMGTFNDSGTTFLDLGRRIAEQSGEIREGNFLFQRLSVLIQRFNAVQLHDSFVDV